MESKSRLRRSSAFGDRFADLWVSLTEEHGPNVLHALGERAKRAVCFVAGHVIEYDTSSGGYYPPSYEAYCERCNDYGRYDGLRRIPRPLAWIFADAFNAIRWRIEDARQPRSAEEPRDAATSSPSPSDGEG